MRLIDQAEPVVKTAGDCFHHLHQHIVWVTEDGTSCDSLASETFELVESDEEPEPTELPPPAPDGGAPTSEALIFESVGPDDGSHLRASPRAEGVVSLVAPGPQASLQIAIPAIPNTSVTPPCAILDTGCQRSVVGRKWLQGAGVGLEWRFGFPTTPYRQALMVAFGPHPAELSEYSYSIPVGIAGVPLTFRASGFSGSRCASCAIAGLCQLGAMLSFPDQEVVFTSLTSYLKDGAPSGMRVSTPLYRTREIGDTSRCELMNFPFHDPGGFPSGRHFAG